MATAIGIDLGSDKVSVARLRSRGATVTLDRYVTISFDELRSAGVDPEDTPRLASAIADRLNMRRVPTSGMIVGIAGRHTIIRYSHLPTMPAWRLKLLMEYEINEVAEKAGEELTADFAIVPANSSEPGYSVLVALAKDAAIGPTIGALTENRLDIAGGLPSAVAVGEALRFLGNPEPSGYTIVADIGRSSTDVAVLDGGQLVFARTISSGGDAFNERIIKQYDCSEDEAEELKLSRRGPDGETLAPVLRPAFEQLGRLIASTLSYMGSQLKIDGRVKPARLFVTGGSARMPGLAGVLGQSLDCPAEVWDPLAGIETSTAPAEDRDDVEQEGISAAVACGLALRELFPSATRLDLLPNALRAKRTWKHRTVWLIAAGVVLMLQALFSLGLAWHRLSGERARAARIRSENQKHVAERTARHESRVEDNEKRERFLAALASHARPGRHLQAVLEVLSRTMPNNMTVTSIELETLRPKRAARGETGLPAAPTIKVHLKGVVDNAQLRCEQELAELEEVIRLDPAVESAQIVPTGSTEKPRVDFAMTVQPKDPES